MKELLNNANYFIQNCDNVMLLMKNGESNYIETNFTYSYIIDYLDKNLIKYKLKYLDCCNYQVMSKTKILNSIRRDFDGQISESDLKQDFDELVNRSFYRMIKLV